MLSDIQMFFFLIFTLALIIIETLNFFIRIFIHRFYKRKLTKNYFHELKKFKFLSIIALITSGVNDFYHLDIIFFSSTLKLDSYWSVIQSMLFQLL